MTLLDKDPVLSAETSPADVAPARRRPRLSLGRFTGVVIALVVVCVYLALTQPVFLSWGNITNIVASNSVILLLALGATFVIIGGGFDLSAASALSATGMVLGLALQAGLPAWVAIASPILAGLVIGLVQGVLISYVKISMIVVTLGFMSILASFALIVNKGATISVYDTPGFDPIYQFVNGTVGPIPLLMIFDAVVLLVAAFVLRYTAFGRSLFAMGSNPEAARLNGINTAMMVLFVFLIAGLAAGLAGMVSVGRLTGAAAASDPTLLMTAIAAVLIGGTAFTGGEGGVLGTMIGVLFLGVIQNGMTLSEIPAFWQGTVNGAILILAVGIGVLRDRGIRLRRKAITSKVG
ncbi:ABC transporter permease [Pseudonocardia halophobica]|uniref:ABC transporter permease n=1 Tax=Pseudonocardia halophobica TaxID=29401 RepID=UPI003D8BB565